MNLRKRVLLTLVIALLGAYLVLYLVRDGASLPASSAEPGQTTIFMSTLHRE